jgi:oligopeptide transport system substrate-binding protein
MNNSRTTSRLAKRFATGLGVVVLASSVAIPAGGAKQVPSAAAKNNLTIMIQEPNAGWCNQDSPGVDQVAAKNAVLETLTMKNDKDKIVPYLAEAFSANADKTQWTFKLRSGILFTDGEELSSDTVQMNLLANNGMIQSVTKQLYGKAMGQAGSLPAIAWLDQMGVNSKSGAAAIGAAWAKYFKKIDKYNFVITLAKPDPNFPYKFWSEGRPTIMSTKALLDPNCGTTVVVGTGPFKVKSKGVDQNTTVLEANTNYWRSTKANPLPKAQEVTFKVVGDAAQRVNALRSGQADIATFGSTAGVQLNLIKTLKSKITLVAGKQEVTWNAHLNTTALPFKSKNAREALGYAFDGETFVKVMTKGNAIAAKSIAPSMHPYFVPNQTKTFDLAKAKASVIAYKAETGKDLEVVMPITTTTDSLKQAQLVCKFVEAAGAKCSIMSPVTSSQYILRGFGLQQQLSVFNVAAGTSASFTNLFSTATDLELSGFRLTNPTLAACFDTARQTDTKAAYKPCVTELQSNSYWIPMYTESGFLAYRNEIKGIGATTLLGGGLRPIIGPSGFDFASAVKPAK